MELEELENVASREKINIVNYKMKNKARILNNHIFMDYSQINTYAEEKYILAEELGHYYYDSYYSFNSTQIDIDRAEYRAKKYIYQSIVPYSELRHAISKGFNTSYEIAEELAVPEETIKKAIEFYKNKYGQIITNEEMQQ